MKDADLTIKLIDCCSDKFFFLFCFLGNIQKCSVLCNQTAVTIGSDLKCSAGKVGKNPHLGRTHGDKLIFPNKKTVNCPNDKAKMFCTKQFGWNVWSISSQKEAAKAALESFAFLKRKKKSIHVGCMYSGEFQDHKAHFWNRYTFSEWVFKTGLKWILPREAEKQQSGLSRVKG